MHVNCVSKKETIKFKDSTEELTFTPSFLFKIYSQCKQYDEEILRGIISIFCSIKSILRVSTRNLDFCNFLPDIL